METIVLEPDYLSLIEFFASGLTDGSWEQGFLGPAIQLIEMTRYMQEKDPKGLEETLCRIRRMQHRRNDPEKIYVQYCDSYDSITQSCAHSSRKEVNIQD